MAILRIAPTPTASPCLSTVICCSTRGFGTSTPAPTPRPRMARHSTLPACSSRCANTLMHPTLPYANSKHLSRSEAVHIRAIRYSIFRQKWPTPRKTWGIAPARMRRIIPGTKVLTASRACGTHLIRMASPRPAPIKPKRIRISRWSSIRLPVAVSSV